MYLCNQRIKMGIIVFFWLNEFSEIKKVRFLISINDFFTERIKRTIFLNNRSLRKQTNDKNC